MTAATAAVRNSFEGCAHDLRSLDSSASVSRPFARRFSSRPSLLHRRQPDRFLIAHPEDVGPDEAVLFLEHAQPARHLFERLRGAGDQLGQDSLLPHQHSLVAALQLREIASRLAVPLRRQPFQHGVVLDLVGQRVLDQLELDIGQCILIVLQLRLDAGQLVPQDPVALGTDAAEVVIQPQSIEPADVPIIEKLLDLVKVGLCAVGQGTLLLQCGVSAGGQGLFVLDDPCLELEELGPCGGPDTAPADRRPAGPCSPGWPRPA